MTARSVSLILSYPVVMVLLVALTLGMVLLGWHWGLGLSTLYLLAVPLVVAFAYLAWYRTLPFEPAPPRPAAAGTGIADEVEEPFEDPVEEADRWDDTKGPAAEPESEESTHASEEPSPDDESPT